MSILYQKQSIKVYQHLIDNHHIKSQDIRVILYLSYCLLDRLIKDNAEKHKTKILLYYLLSKGNVDTELLFYCLVIRLVKGNVEKYDTRLAKKITALAEDLEIYRPELNKSLKKLHQLGLLIKEKSTIHLNPSVCFFDNLRYYPATSTQYLLEHPELQTIKNIKDISSINLTDIQLSNNLTATISEDIFRISQNGLKKLLDKKLTKKCYELILFLMINQQNVYSTYKLAEKLSTTRQTASNSLKTLISLDLVHKDKTGLYLNPYCAFKGSIKQWKKAKELWRFFHSSEYKKSIK